MVVSRYTTASRHWATMASWETRGSQSPLSTDTNAIRKAASNPPSLSSASMSGVTIPSPAPPHQGPQRLAQALLALQLAVHQAQEPLEHLAEPLRALSLGHGGPRSIGQPRLPLGDLGAVRGDGLAPRLELV